MATAPAAALDPITVEVISSSFASITEEMGEALVRASHSTNIKERRDCSTALLDAQGRALCQAEHIPIHLGSFIGFIPFIIDHNPPGSIRPGDTFIGNDPYAGGGTHLPDIVLAEPIFHEDDLIGWAINTAHHADFVDRGHAHIYQEGLRIPPIRLYREGRLIEEVQDLILTNCQVPKERLSDLRAQMASNRLGVQRMGELCRRHGADVVKAAGEALLDYAERKMRAGIATIPDGTYRFSEVFDCDDLAEDLELSVAITVEGEEMRLDFDGPPQLRNGFNVVRTALLSTVYYAVKCVVDPTILPNAGLARPITVNAPEGSVLNCVHPAAVDSRDGTCQRLADLIRGALAQAVPERLTAAGNGSCSYASFIGSHPDDGSLWVYLETIGGGMGARASKDGLSGVHVHLTNTSNLPVEALEPEYPITLLRYELVDGSGGAGTHRGGLGLRRVYRADAPCRVELHTSRTRTTPWGLNGGLDGGHGEIRLSPGVVRDTDGTFVMHAGDIFEVVTPGAGGYGPPEARSAEAVARDVAEGRIDAARAQEIYGVSA